MAYLIIEHIHHTNIMWWLEMFLCDNNLMSDGSDDDATQLVLAKTTCWNKWAKLTQTGRYLYSWEIVLKLEQFSMSGVSLQTREIKLKIPSLVLYHLSALWHFFKKNGLMEQCYFVRCCSSTGATGPFHKLLLSEVAVSLLISHSPNSPTKPACITLSQSESDLVKGCCLSTQTLP